MKGFCILCQNKRELRESHVLSKFLYRPLKEQDATMAFLCHRSDYQRPDRQDGLKEHLLCKECEERRQPYEAYMSNALRNQSLRINPGVGKYDVLKFDYNKFKLFTMYNIFLTSASNLIEYSNMRINVNLEEDLRDMLLNNDPGDVSEFGCIMDWILGPPEYRKIVASPVVIGIPGFRFIVMIYGGFVWRCFPRVPNKKSELITRRYIKKDGRIIVERMKLGYIFQYYYSEYPEMRSLYKSLKS